MKLISTDRLTREQILNIVGDSEYSKKSNTIEYIDYIYSKPNRYIITSSVCIDSSGCDWKWINEDGTLGFYAEIDGNVFVVDSKGKLERR
jgi:hypothetical protein